MAVDGQAFDRQFMDQVVRDHEAAVADFEKAAGVDGECRVKAFARSQLPTLRERLDTARRIRSALGAAPAGPARVSWHAPCFLRRRGYEPEIFPASSPGRAEDPA